VLAQVALAGGVFNLALKRSDATLAFDPDNRRAEEVVGMVHCNGHESATIAGAEKALE
jgi:hypothetical protein